jgi:hypothetical protein
MAMDRNERARQIQHLQSQRLQVIRALENGTAAARDRFDNKIVKGTLVVWKSPIDHLWVVVDVEAVPITEGAPGTVRLTLQCQVPADMIVNAPNQGFIVVGKSDGAGQSELFNNASDGPAVGEGSHEAVIGEAATGEPDASADDPAAKILTGDFDRDRNGGGDGGGSIQ